MNIAVVGGGLAGLAVALGCEQDGHDVSLFEASDALGGRMKTLHVNGHPLDAGFHVLHTAYPSLARWMDVGALGGKPMDACTMTIQPSTGKRRVLGDALHAPRYLFPTLRSVGVRDGLRFLRWRLGTSGRDLERSMDAPTPTIKQGLKQRNFSASTRRVLEPLFAGITLDPSLSERMAFANFAWGAMSHGEMIVPYGGIAAVPNQLASRLKTTTVHLNTRVENVTATTVDANGETMPFDRVVLAVPQHVAQEVFSPLDGTHKPVERLTSTVAFVTKTPPYSEGRLLLNEEWGQHGNDVLHVHLPTNVHPHPAGEHWVVATLVGAPATSPDVESVRHELRKWFGESVSNWKHLATTTVRYALPHIDPTHHERFMSEIEIEGVLLAGDHRAHPSVQGTLRSAERILEHLKIPIPKEV
tara:strand:+ start:473 stop:1717 length:1245 start_codon:yes stop_codon:yes gene_type:complete